MNKYRRTIFDSTSIKTLISSFYSYKIFRILPFESAAVKQYFQNVKVNVKLIDIIVLISFLVSGSKKGVESVQILHFTSPVEFISNMLIKDAYTSGECERFGPIGWCKIERHIHCEVDCKLIAVAYPFLF